MTPTRQPAPTVHVEGATVRFAGTRLIDDLSFELEGGRCTCLLGPSGVGKTTVLRLVAGLCDPHYGQAHVYSDDAQDLSTRTAYMAQQDLLLPWLRVEDNVLLGARLRRQQIGPRQRQRARALLHDLGIGNSADALPRELSGGMRQRAALARTLYEQRAVVLMDEPFAALDAITRHRLQELAARHLAGRTVLLITHDPMEALRLGHSIHVLSGRPVTFGDALKVAGEPPRSLHREDLMALHAQLIDQLSAAQDNAAH